MAKKSVITHVVAALLIFYIVATLSGARAQEGWVLDVITQKGGEGQNVPDGTFTIGETVILTANLTYNGAPVASILVGFSALDPTNGTIMSRAVPTNGSGFASVNFTIPLITDSLGTWTIICSAQAADQIIWDYSSFEVISRATHPPIARFVETFHEALVDQQIYFDASSSAPGFDGDDECPIMEYRWDFGDGNLTKTNTPTVYHAYSSSGTYYVTLTVFAPGIPFYIDPLYVDTNTTSSPQKKLIFEIPVGGHTQTFGNLAKTNPVVPVFAPAAMLAITFIVIKRKRTRDK